MVCGSGEMKEFRKVGNVQKENSGQQHGMNLIYVFLSSIVYLKSTERGSRHGGSNYQGAIFRNSFYKNLWAMKVQNRIPIRCGRLHRKY